MGSNSNITDALDDSGYVQEDTPKMAVDEYKGSAELLDLSDDVLLFILRHCSPQDLKALAFTCPRLGSLVLDRTLWTHVDARGAPSGRRRVRWLLARALAPHTTALKLTGHAAQAKGCLGFMNRYDNAEEAVEEERYLCGGARVYRLTQTSPTNGILPFLYPTFPNGRPPSPEPTDTCPGPQLTFTHTGLRALSTMCTSLTTLVLEHVVIDCQTTTIGMFPRSLVRLSLLGTKCYNLDCKSFLFKIQDHLTLLEELDVSYCSWIEPACILPLSKMSSLWSLSMRECYKLAEFVAYASLASRYGFKKLKVLDLRGSPVGDSEVSALGWLPSLEELYLAPAPDLPPVKEHAHYTSDNLPVFNELEEWEEKEPEYFKPPEISEEEWRTDEDRVPGAKNRSFQASNDDPSGCILLERMVAEPVSPDDYARVYNQLYMAGNYANVPITNPDQYRELFRHYMIRPHQDHPPAGYSLFIRRNTDAKKRTETSPTTERADEPQPGTSTEGTKADDAKPGTSGQKRKAEDDKSDHSDDDDNDSGAAKVKAEPAKKDTGATKPKKSKKLATPRRVFEITITETGEVRTTHGAQMAWQQAIDPTHNNNNNRQKNNNQNQSAKQENAESQNQQPQEPMDASEADNQQETEENKEEKIGENKEEMEDQTSDKIEGNSSKEDNPNEEEPMNTDNDACVKLENTVKENDEENSEINAPSISETQTLDDDVKPSCSYTTANINNDTENTEQPVIAATNENQGNIENDTNDNDPENDNNRSENARDSEINDATSEKTENKHNPNGCSSRSKAGSARPSASNDASARRNSNIRRLRELVPPEIRHRVLNVRRNEEILNALGEVIRLRDRDALPRDQDALPRDQDALERDQDALERDLDPLPRDPDARAERLFQFRQNRRVVIEELQNAAEALQPRPPRGVLFSDLINVHLEPPPRPPRQPGVQFSGNPVPARLDHASLISDAAIRRFGRSVGENINYLYIGGGPPALNPYGRPDRSNLRVLSAVGFRHITDLSLTHLISAAPQLRSLNVTGTGVTARTLRDFCAARPDVEVISDHPAADLDSL